MFDSCSSRNNGMSSNATHQSTSKSSTLASIKSSLIAKVNHASIIRRQRSAVDPCVSDVTSTQSDGLAVDVLTEVAAGRRAEGRGSVPAQSGVHRRRVRSPFSSSRVLSEPNKPQRSSLAEQRIIESVVFRPSATSSSGRSAVHQIRDTGDGQAAGCRRRSADVAAGVDDSPDVVIDRQGVVVFKRSLSHGQGCHQSGQSTSSTTLVRSVSTDNSREQLLPFINGNFNELSYNSESYLNNRAAPCSRRGFGGNYRRRSPRPEASSTTPTRFPPTSPVFDASLIAGGDADDDYVRRLGTQSMPGTLDRRYCRDRKTQFDASLLIKAAVDLSQSYQEEQAPAIDLSSACFSSMSRSSDIIETDPVAASEFSSNESNLASGEIADSRCQEKRTPQESTDMPATENIDEQNGELLKVIPVSATADDREPMHLCAVVRRQRRSHSDEAKTARCERKEFTGEDVRRHRRCRSLERRQSSTDAKHLRCDVVTSPGGGDRSGEPGCVGTVRKSDSFDSGIDTKSETMSPRTGGTDDMVDGGINSRPDIVSPPSDVSSTRRDVTPEVLSLTPAEVEYDRKAATLVLSLGDDDADLRRVLSSLVSYRVPTSYMCGVFDNVVRPLSSNFAEADERSELSVTDDRSISTDQLKTSLLCCVRKKLKALDDENQRLSTQLLQTQQASAVTSEMVNGKVNGKLREMFHLYVNDLSKVLRLLLMLANRLARADNALIITKDDSNNHRAALTIKRDELRERFDDALELKTGIDRRRARLDAALRDALTSDELTVFRSSVDSACRLRIDEHWINDRVEISQKQLGALMNSILSSSEATEC